MPITIRPTGECAFCNHETVGYIEIRDGDHEPVPVCNRCWKVRADEEDLPKGSKAAIVDRKEDY